MENIIEINICHNICILVCWCVNFWKNSSNLHILVKEDKTTLFFAPPGSQKNLSLIRK